MRWLTLLGLLALACAPLLPPLGDADRQWARRAFPEAEADLDGDRALFADKCGGCHTLPLPAQVPQAAWPEVIAKMRPRAKLDDAQHKSVLRYVLTASRPQP